MDCIVIEVLKSITPIIALIGMVVAACVAIVNIRKAARESRASMTHLKMIEALQENVSFFRRSLILLGNVSNKIIHTNKHKEVNNENAIDRYWKEIDELKKRYENVAPQLQLFLPKELFKLSKSILSDLNKARDIVNRTNPIPTSPNSDTTELRELLDIINKDYFQFLEDSRSVIGTNVLGSIGKKIGFTTELYGTESKQNQ